MTRSCVHVAAVVSMAAALLVGCRRDDVSKRGGGSTSPPGERPTPGIVGTWATTELAGSAESGEEDYWLFRADGTMVECNTVVGPQERKYELTDGGLNMMNLAGFATNVEVVSMNDGKMHVRFLGIDKKLEKLAPSDSRKFKCDGVKPR